MWRDFTARKAFAHASITNTVMSAAANTGELLRPHRCSWPKLSRHVPALQNSCLLRNAMKSDSRTRCFAFPSCLLQKHIVYTHTDITQVQKNNSNFIYLLMFMFANFYCPSHLLILTRLFWRTFIHTIKAHIFNFVLFVGFYYIFFFGELYMKLCVECVGM